MFNLKSVVFIVLLILSSSVLSYQFPYLYFFEDGEINVIGLDKKKVKIDVDFNSFKIADPFRFHAIDKNYVYYLGEKLDKLNPNETIFIGGISSLINNVPGYDGYIKDKNNVYFQGEWVEGADANTFEIFGENKKTIDKNKKLIGVSVFAKDKNTFYVNNKKIDRDINTFKLLGGDYSIDKNGVYFKETKIENVNPNSFLIKEYHDNLRYHYNMFIISNSTVFFNGKKIKLDASSFNILYSNQYFRSNNKVIRKNVVSDKGDAYIINDEEKIIPLNIYFPYSFNYYEEYAIMLLGTTEITAKDMLFKYNVKYEDNTIDIKIAGINTPPSIYSNKKEYFIWICYITGGFSFLFIFRRHFIRSKKHYKF